MKRSSRHDENKTKPKDNPVSSAWLRFDVKKSGWPEKVVGSDAYNTWANPYRQCVGSGRLWSALAFLGFVFRYIPESIVYRQSSTDSPASNPASIYKPPPAVPDVLEIDFLDHVSQREGGTTAAAHEECRASASSNSRSSEQADLHGTKAHEEPLRLDMREGNTLDACFGIVLDIHVRIDSIIQNRPRYIRRVEKSSSRQRRRVREKIDAERWEPHERTPREGEPQHELRIVRHPLGQRV